MKLTSSTTTTLLPFAPHQQIIPSSHSSQRASARSSVHSRVPIISSILYSMPSSARLRGLFDAPRRPNPLRIRPSTISETSYESESSCASSASSSSSSFPNTSPTSCSTPLSSLPPSPPPSTSSFGKSRPLPKIPKSPPPPTSSPLPHPLPATSPPPRPRSPPPAWSPPQTIPVSRRSPPPPSSSARPQRPKVMLPPTPPQRLSSATLRPASRIYSPPIDDDGSLTALPPAPLRVRPLPMRPAPPGPPGEGDTPVAQFGRVRWISEPSLVFEDDDSALCDDRRAIDWDLIDEVMTHSS
ncbi:hypothetical protein V8E53_015808 [Lactarius tabidus]